MVRANTEMHPPSTRPVNSLASKLGGGRPADGEHGAVGFGLPGVFDAGSPDDVVAGAFEDEGADRHILAPFAADEE